MNIVPVDIDYWRQLDLFSPTKFKKPITVIGAGATGSYVVWLLAKMGCRDITVYDFDRVESHNTPNQIFGPADIDLLKVDALKRIVGEASGILIKSCPERFERGKLRGIVFVLTDTMESRKQIWQSSLRLQPHVDLVIETRMAADHGRIYAIKPTLPRQIAGYEKTLYPDVETEESPCTRQAIAPTVAVVSGMAVFTMIQFVNGESFANETIVSLAPPMVITRKFS